MFFLYTAAIYRHLLSDRKFGLTHNLLATKVMPSLIPLSISPGYSLDQVQTPFVSHITRPYLNWPNFVWARCDWSRGQGKLGRFAAHDAVEVVVAITAAAPVSEIEAIVRSPTNMDAAKIAAVDFNKMTSLDRPACLRPCSLLANRRLQTLLIGRKKSIEYVL